MGGHSQHIDKRYRFAFKPRENIRDMRKRIMFQLEQEKLLKRHACVQSDARHRETSHNTSEKRMKVV